MKRHLLQYLPTYALLSVIIVFPFIVWLGAGGKVAGKTKQIFKFLGGISYPIYITHYPVMYVFYTWLVNNGYSFSEALARRTAVVSLALVYGLMKLYDRPLKAWLTNRFLSAKNKVTLYKSV